MNLQDRQAYMRAWKKANPDKVRAQWKRDAQTERVRKYRNEWKKRYAAKHPEKVRATRQKTLARHGDRYRVARRGGYAGLTIKQFEAMLRACSGLCEVCRGPMKKVNVDHDHATHKVRGLLCSGCNTFAGWLETRAHLFSAMADYLERYRK
jgi:hypothetical protein